MTVLSRTEELQSRAPDSQGIVAVVDPVGRVFECVRQLQLPVAVWRVFEPWPLESAPPFRRTIYAAYGPIDWEVVAEVAARTPTVIVTAIYERDQAMDALRHHLDGYLDLALPAETLERALRGALLNHEPGYTRDVLGAWIREQRTPVVETNDRLGTLTERQREIIGLVAGGATDKEIATRLGIAQATAEKHVTNILRRLDVANRAAAVAAVRGGIAIDRRKAAS